MPELISFAERRATEGNIPPEGLKSDMGAAHQNRFQAVSRETGLPRSGA